MGAGESRTGEGKPGGMLEGLDAVLGAMRPPSTPRTARRTPSLQSASESSWAYASPRLGARRERRWCQPPPKPSATWEEDPPGVRLQEHMIELLGSQPSARLVESADSASHSPASLTTPTSRQRRERGRIEAARDRSRSRPRVRERGRTSSGRTASGDCWGPATPTSAAGSRSALYLSDDDGCGGAEEDVEPDGITVIQSALDSGSYRDKVNLQFLKIRQQQDLEHNGPDNKTSVNMVQTFYNKKQTQNMLPDERRVLEDVRKVGTQVDHIRGVRASAEGNFWNPHPGELSSTFILKTGGRTKGLKKDLREAKYVEDIREAQIHSRVQQSRADNEAKQTRIRRHEDIESDPPPNTWAAPNAHERPERPPPPPPRKSWM